MTVFYLWRLQEAGGDLPRWFSRSQIFMWRQKGFLYPGHRSLSRKREPEASVGKIEQDPRAKGSACLEATEEPLRRHSVISSIPAGPCSPERGHIWVPSFWPL